MDGLILYAKSRGFRANKVDDILRISRIARTTKEEEEIDSQRKFMCKKYGVTPTYRNVIDVKGGNVVAYHLEKKQKPTIFNFFNFKIL